MKDAEWREPIYGSASALTHVISSIGSREMHVHLLPRPRLMQTLEGSDCAPWQSWGL